MAKSVVFGGESPGSGCRWFRAEIPARSVRPYWDSHVANYVLVPNDDDREQRLSATDNLLRGEIINPPDVMTMRIMDEVDVSSGQAEMDLECPFAYNITKAREAGQILLYDIDDDIWDIPEWSPAAKAMNKLLPSTRAYDLEVIDRNIRACSGVIVSTPYLQRRLEQMFPDTPCHLMGPGIDPSVYLKRKHEWNRQPLQVGWMGSIHHYLPHLQTMWEALEVLNDYGAEFVHLGKVRDDNAADVLAKMGVPVRHLPWAYIHKLPEHLVQLDIGIIPRSPTRFNEGQSITSGLQYACAGVPFLVAPSDEYYRAESQGMGTVCETVDDWAKNLDRLLRDPDYRFKRRWEAQATARSLYGLQPTGQRYVELLERLTERED
jgi:glycosyltransferase involved in cell wall biosynthesis